jgi:hypothetical protein
MAQTKNPAQPHAGGIDYGIIALAIGILAAAALVFLR